MATNSTDRQGGTASGTSTQDRRQGVNASAAVKVPCVVATTANITLSGEQTIDGVAVVTDDRILVKDQTDGIENGIYEVDTSTWNRSPDWDGSLDVKKGTLIYVHSGTVNTGWWGPTTADTITPGTTSVTISTIEIKNVIATGSTTPRSLEDRFADVINVLDYGAVGDGVTDDTDALNTAFAYASNNGLSVYIPAGVYVISDTLWATPSGSSVQTCHIVGAGMGNENTTAGGITVIDASSLTDRPAINIHMARFAYLGHFLVVGGGEDIEVNLAVEDMLYDADWVDASYRDSRYSPHCGIAIDAGVGVTPPDGGYPSFTYRGSSSSGTLGFHLDHIAIRRFVVGVMHNPDSSAAQGDTWLMTQPNITSTKVAIASGQAQAQAGTIIGGTIWYCRSAFDGSEYGQKQGVFPHFINTQFVVMFEMFSGSGGFGTLHAVGCRAEEVHRIGYSGGSASAGQPAVFDGMDVHLLDPVLNAQSRCPIVYDGLSASLVWTGGYLGEGDYTGEGEHFAIIADNATLDSVFLSVANRFQPYVGGIQDLNSPAFLRNCRVGDGTATIIYGESARRFSMSGRVSEQASPSRRVRGTTFYEYIPKNNNNYTNIGTMSSISFTATTLTFDNTDPNSFVVDDLIIWRFLAIGKSAVLHLIPGAKVTDITSNTVTCDLLYPRSYYDETYTGAGSFTQIFQRMWAPGEALTGDTNSSTSLTNVSPTTILKNGDWITAGSGIAANTRVVSGEGTATITLSRAATDAAAGKTLYWDRLHTVTTAAAF